MDFRVCAVFSRFCRRQIWGSDCFQGEVSDNVISSTTPKPIFESSHNGRIRKPRGGVRLDFSKFWVCWVTNTAISEIVGTRFLALRHSSQKRFHVYCPDIFCAFACSLIAGEVRKASGAVRKRSSFCRIRFEKEEAHFLLYKHVWKERTL